MRFIHRLGYYLGGFAIGLILLAFFLSGKKTSCDYGPNARAIKNISLKKRILSDNALLSMNNANMDSLQLESLIKTGHINFSKSDTKRDSCKLYVIENEFFERPIELIVINCDSTATINTIKM